MSAQNIISVKPLATHCNLPYGAPCRYLRPEGASPLPLDILWHLWPCNPTCSGMPPYHDPHPSNVHFYPNAGHVSSGYAPAVTNAAVLLYGSWITLDAHDSAETADLMFDPQTSGGLILGIPAERTRDLLAALIAEGVKPATEIREVLVSDPEGHLGIV